MNLLLDTHAFLWFITADNKISINAKTEIENINNSVFVSLVSIWEIAIKHKLGKLQLNYAFENIFNEAIKSGIEIITLEKPDLIQLDSLDLIHNDPFDRLLVAQSIIRGFTFVSKDEIIKKYPVSVLW